MNVPVQGDTPAAVTPRLVFDNPVNEEDIPRFLRKSSDLDTKPAIVPKIETTVEIVEPETPVTIADPVVPSTEPETNEPVVAPAAIVEEAIEHRTEQEFGSATPSNLNELSVEELKQQEEEIQRRIREKQQAEKQAVIDQIVSVVNMYHIPIEELVDALGGLKVKRKGVKAKAKYQDPVTGTIWSGRGKEPAWIKGKDRKPFLISE